jgi:hypothetical protein
VAATMRRRWLPKKPMNARMSFTLTS